MLTKEEILQKIKNFPSLSSLIGETGALQELFNAVEEYANQDKWVKTEDQLPPIDKSDEWNELHKVSIEVFTYSEFGMRKGRYYYHSDNWSISYVTGSVRVIGWQPLPAPPKQ